jgi:hypothetical protein
MPDDLNSLNLLIFVAAGFAASMMRRPCRRLYRAAGPWLRILRAAGSKPDRRLDC